jgi:hypothetical protein
METPDVNDAAVTDTPVKPPEPARARRPAPAAPRVPPAPIATRSVTVALADGATLPFDIADGTGEAPCFCLGVRKSGSTMLNRIVQQLARRNRYHAVDVPGTFFRNGYRVQHWEQADLSALIAPGNVYVGFRNFPKSFQAFPGFQSARKVFMFRDPRDALVSQYFSDAYSHHLPTQTTEQGKKGAADFEKKRQEALETDIDAYVVKHARGMENTLIAFAPMLEDPTCLLLRYEEYVFQKRRLIYKVLRHFDWSCLPGQVDAVLTLVDEVPASEDKTRFVRRVIPGDHRNKLKPETIARLNNVLRESMRLFDYY